MVSHCSQVVLFATFLFAPASFFDLANIEDRLDNVFLKINVTVEDSQLIFANAKESYRTLKDYRKEKDPGSQRRLLTILRVFTEKVIEDIQRKEINISEIFKNINSYLKGTTNLSNDPKMDPETLANVVQAILTAADKRLDQYYAVSHRNRFDIERILVNDSNVENLFREDSSIDATSIGYFFLETFATLLGLSWGIISMIISGIQTYQ